jgi:hypothetical protein
MSGSRKWFNYTDDAGTNHGVFTDESKGEANGVTGVAFLTPVVTGTRGLPIGLTPRGFYAESTTGPVRKTKFYVSTNAQINAIAVGDPVNERAGGLTPATSWRVVSKFPEKLRG